MPDANNDDLTRVRTALAGLTQSGDDALLLAVSGGPDSMAMLDLVHRCWPGSVFAATVDHRLRPESADEARMVAGFCAEAGLAHATLDPDQPITGSVQAAARAVRYRLLLAEADRVSARWIVTAHHADDQLETMLMRLARGSGVHGLAGVRARNGRIIRPLLGWTKAQLCAHCAWCALPFAHDPSNANTDFDRVRMRQALAGFDAIDPVQAVRSANALAEAADALDWVTAREVEAAIADDGAKIVLHRTYYPAALLRRLVQNCIERVERGIEPRGPAMDRLIATLQSGGQAMIGNVLCRGGDTWHFGPAPARKGRRVAQSGTEYS